MHQALLIPEVLLGIFAHVNEHTDLVLTANSRRSLASLAKTCNSFHEPAMDLLWANIDDLEKLLGCVTRLHPMIYCSDARPGSLWSSEGVEPLSEHEACQFLRHAARVRSIDISYDDHFHLLTVLPTETCMFPRLMSLLWEIEAPESRYLHLFLSRTLRDCRLSAPHPALTTIGTHCAFLDYLKISDFDEVTADDLSLLSSAVRSCTRLKFLGCPPLEWAAWNHLSTLPTLLNLQIYSGSWPFEQPNLKFAPFLNITLLTFYVHIAEYAITAMQFSEFPSLTCFEMSIHVLSWAEAEQLFCALLQCNARLTLEQIIISSRDPDDEDGSDNYLTVITQFLCFSQLRTLSLVFDNCAIYLDNDLLLEAVSRWPYIHHMKLDDQRLQPPVVTFRGLFAALRRCPHLETLQLHIDAVNIDIDPETESFQHTTLKSFHVGFSNVLVADAEAVARIIFCMLPCVDQVGYADSEEWDEVNKCLASFKSPACPLTPEL
ncbi:hypothetical protein EV702DRAFT_1275777 [Suillus placidus]|uniref:F-box domain-containing protein n=1 Tax=Suillus placidus TaxID=48579 RepID=A0A9P7A369_9AGAM|nr:hypothetical protein EV702DRAFT_1275777 [Suillus placidus]